MFRSFDVAAGGLRTHQQYIDVVGNNVANVNSDGFKGSAYLFDEVLNQLTYGTGIAPPAVQPNGAINAAMAGLGVAMRQIPGDFSQGAFKATNIATDLAIEGEGFFVLQGTDGPVYTRNGNFTFDATGTLVAGDGKRVLGIDDQPIRVSTENQSGSLSLNARGEVIARDEANNQVVIGQVKLARFPQQNMLERVGDTQFRQSAGSGAPIEGAPSTNGLGSVISGVTEMSNVDLATQFTNLIMAQRGFQANSRVLSTTDELAERINQMQ